MSYTKQAQKFCRACKRKTLHIASVKQESMGCGFVLGNLILCVITFGLWIPIFMLALGLGMFSNSAAPLSAKFYCHDCGRRFTPGNAFGALILFAAIVWWFIWKNDLGPSIVKTWHSWQ